MARSRKSHSHRKEEANIARNGLEPAYGKTGENRYAIYVSYPRPDMNIPKLLILTFKARYAARFFLDQLIGEDEYEPGPPIGSRQSITTGLGLRISMFGTDLSMLLDYELNDREREWVDEKVISRVRALKYGITDEDRAIRRTTLGVVEEELTEDRPAKEKKETKPKVDKTGLISASDIAKELGLEGKDVRVILRSMKLEKSPAGWLFDEKTAADIKKQVAAGLKEPKKK